MELLGEAHNNKMILSPEGQSGYSSSFTFVVLITSLMITEGDARSRKQIKDLGAEVHS